MINILLVIFVILVIWIMSCVQTCPEKLMETFGSSTGGALIQLMAKDQQDDYLSVGSYGNYGYSNYNYPGYYYPYFPFRSQLWNNPTRIRSYYYPYLYHDPTYYPWYYTYA